MGELETKTEFVAPTAKYPESAELRRASYESMKRAQQNNELITLNRKLNRIQSQINNLTVDDDIDALEEQRSEVENKILQANYDLQSTIELPLTEEEKGEWRQSQKACGTRQSTATCGRPRRAACGTVHSRAARPRR